MIDSLIISLKPKVAMKLRPAFYAAQEFLLARGSAERSPTHPYQTEDVAETLRPKASSDLGALSLHSYNTLLAPEESFEATPEILLADSLDKLEHAGLSPHDKKIVRGIAQYDARQFASGLLPHDTSEASNTQPDEYVPPSLKDLLLIAQAYDDLEDPELLHILRLVIEQDGIDKEFKQAVEASILTGNPIYKEYHKILAESGARIDSNAEDDGQRQIVSWMKEASLHPVPHIEKLVARHKKDDTDENGTGFIM